VFIDLYRVEKENRKGEKLLVFSSRQWRLSSSSSSSSSTFVSFLSESRLKPSERNAERRDDLTDYALTATTES